MNTSDILSTSHKALKINLDQSIFGSFAEIGAGQEVARNFFQAGGASGTIAKTISAYDMSFSDNIYGESISKRYVSRDRLQKMLKTEAQELTSVLKDKMNPKTRFFVFADTVTTINFNKDKEGQGWLGVRYQLDPKGKPNEVVLHVRMLENDPLQQQKTLGILGTNLIYACFHHHHYPNWFLQSLFDSLHKDQLEITMISMSGPNLDYVDNRLLGVQLVKNGMARAIMFDAKGNLQHPADMLYKKNVMAFRGGFRPITYTGLDMIKSSYDLFKNDPDHHPNDTITLCEITINNLLDDDDFSEQDFLDRVDILNGIGQNVMVSNYDYYYKLVSYFSSFRIKNIRIVIGLPTFRKIFSKSYYADLKGGILEAFGKLFPDNMKLYVYPEENPNQHTINNSSHLNLSADLKHIYNYLMENRMILDIKKSNTHKMHFSSKEVIELIAKDDPKWKTMVSNYVATQIETKKLFGFHMPERK
ncbi:MAG: nicotinate-nucleotide adenylyltransferase [Bacteroidetes bacterium 4572_77]|nr:MAG: nicotinate-nucleotide adenylyltransferase [Bacteroidetes bacterium 4572_77]